MTGQLVNLNVDHRHDPVWIRVKETEALKHLDGNTQQLLSQSQQKSRMCVVLKINMNK